MTPIYSNISIETGLLTHFSWNKMITLYEKGMLYVSNDKFP